VDLHFIGSNYTKVKNEIFITGLLFHHF